VIKARFGADFDRVVLGVFPFLSRIGLKPDTLTIMGVVASLASGVAFALGHPAWAAALLFVAGFFDLIDGVVARSQGRSCSFGAFFDSSMDRLADLLVFSGIAVGMAAAGDLGGVVLVCWALSGAIMTSYTRARAERHLENFAIGWMERGERCVILILGGLTGWLELALWVVAIGASVTSVQRLVAARRLLRQLDENGTDPTRQPDPAMEV
jgi:phosphatidylglycerophosphate synthase